MAQKNEFWETFKDLTAGTIGGVSGIVVGQPLDTIKVRLQSQTNNMYKGTMDCFIKTVRREGFLALYKGMLSPVVGNAPMNAVAFGANGNAKRLLQLYFPQSEAEIKKGDPSYLRLYAAGCWAGLMQCIVCTPVELVKCKLQNQKEGIPLYNGPWDCVKKMVKANGLRMGLFRGWWSTVWRDFPSFGAYFVTYEYFKHKLTPAPKLLPAVRTDKTELGLSLEPAFAARPAPSMGVMLFAGGMAGIATWLSTYPFDVLKSQIQTLPDDTPREQTKMWYVAKDSYRKYGMGYFFRGLVPTLIRAVPVNAVTFWIYEESLKGINYAEKYAQRI